MRHISASLLAVLLTAAPPMWSETFSNPVLTGMNPDPTICRVGDDFYLMTSTFEYFGV